MGSVGVSGVSGPLLYGVLSPRYPLTKFQLPTTKGSKVTPTLSKSVESIDLTSSELPFSSVNFWSKVLAICREFDKHHHILPYRKDGSLYLSC